MAIWQYQIFIVPNEEINSYFPEEINISYDDLNEINWWKYRQLTINKFDSIRALLPERKSWTDEIILFGDDNSDCVTISLEDTKIFEISARLDLRTDYRQFARILCEFAQENDCIFLTDDLRILIPDFQLVKNDIENYPIFKAFLD